MAGTTWPREKQHQAGQSGSKFKDKWYDRKAAKTGTIIATKALACKLAKAAWHVMSAQVDYEAERVFGHAGKGKIEEMKT